LPLRDALRQQHTEKGDNWLSKIEQEVIGLGIGNIWRRGGENNDVWREVKVYRH
jgi:hypothetical protein